MIFHAYAGMPPNGAIVFHFGMQGDIVDIITDAKFHINRFRGFEFSTSPNLRYSIGLIKIGLQGGPRKVKPTTILLVTFECVGKIQ